MALSASAQDAELLLTRESAAHVLAGSLGVLGSQRAEGGYTVYRIVFRASGVSCVHTLLALLHAGIHVSTHSMKYIHAAAILNGSRCQED